MENREQCEPPPRFVFEAPDHGPQTQSNGNTSHIVEERRGGSSRPGPSGDAVTPRRPTSVSTAALVSAATFENGLRLNERQGHLFMLYVRQLAPMMDSCDEARHFALSVPRLALNSPMIFYSILAVASRYDALHRGVPPDLDALKYNHYCIEYLIDSLSKPADTYGSELLAAVVIARSYEECDFEADLSHHHLVGTRNLLADETVVRVASQGGLAEAACWVHLRQAIYAYLVRKRPVDGGLDAFTRLTAFTRTDDSAYTNRMVYHFARVLRLSFPAASESTSQSTESRTDLEAEVDGWFKNKPMSFEPVYAADPMREEDFPTIIMMSMATCEYHRLLIEGPG